MILEFRPSHQDAGIAGKAWLVRVFEDFLGLLDFVRRAIYRHHVEKALSLQLEFSDNDYERIHKRCASSNDFECYAASCALLGDADLRHYLSGYRMPVAIMVGEEDYATPVAMAKALHEAIPQSTLKIIGGGRHLTPIQCPDEIASEIGGLLERA